MEFGVYTYFGMANLNMDRNWRIDTLTVRSLNVHENFRMKDISDKQGIWGIYLVWNGWSKFG